jgi:hypothetical protein
MTLCPYNLQQNDNLSRQLITFVAFLQLSGIGIPFDLHPA